MNLKREEKKHLMNHRKSSEHKASFHFGCDGWSVVRCVYNAILSGFILWLDKENILEEDDRLEIEQSVGKLLHAMVAA